MPVVIADPVVDLRSQPSVAGDSYEKDPLQESQLLYGERLFVRERRGDWLFVEAAEQLRFRETTGWTGYPGWVRSDQVRDMAQFPPYNLIVSVPSIKVYEEPQGQILLELSMGSQLQGLQELEETWSVRLLDGQMGFVSKKGVLPLKNHPEDTLRTEILKTGIHLLGNPYLWGGRSGFLPQLSGTLTSCDCSGLVSLIYRVWGIHLPRDAHDQFLHCEPRETADLQVSDLIFLAPAERPERMTHVMLYAGGDAFIDANITDRKTVCSTALQRFGQPLSSVQRGGQLGKYWVHFGNGIKSS